MIATKMSTKWRKFGIGLLFDSDIGGSPLLMGFLNRPLRSQKAWHCPLVTWICTYDHDVISFRTVLPQGRRLLISKEFGERTRCCCCSMQPPYLPPSLPLSNQCSCYHSQPSSETIYLCMNIINNFLIK